jgi:hypothetical protein
MSFEEGSRPLCGDKPGIVVVVELPAKPQWCEKCRTVVRFNRDNGTQAH